MKGGEKGVGGEKNIYKKKLSLFCLGFVYAAAVEIKLYFEDITQTLFIC